MDLPLYTSVTLSDLSDQGYRAYCQFEKSFTLTQVMRQSGQDTDQIRFCDILLRHRNAETTMEDWNHLMEQTPTTVQDQSSFVNALRLFPTVVAVVDHNVVVILLLPSRQYTLEPKQAMHLLMMLVAWNQL